jgi:very-short-patch-repair endonuclease
MYPFIVDFYCASEKLVVELDGEWHASEKKRREDMARENHLRQKYGVRFLRFFNADVLHNTTWVIGRIRRELEGEG